MQDYNGKNQLKYRCYQFSVDIIKFLNSLKYSLPFKVISSQLLRSSTSIGANIIEASAASSKRDFIKFYGISLKSANESKYWLALLKDALNLNDENKNKINALLQELDEISKMLGASLLTMKNKR